MTSNQGIEAPRPELKNLDTIRQLVLCIQLDLIRSLACLVEYEAGLEIS